MRELLLATSTFTLTSLYVLILDYFAGSSFTIQKAIVLPILIILLFVYRMSSTSWKELINNTGKWIILATLTIFFQLLIIATGDIKSPFFIFIHLLMIGISLIFNFSTSLLFLLSSGVVIALDISFRQNIFTLLLSDPYTVILQIFSLIPIIPVSYIISQHYHFKDKLFKTLHAQFITDETILDNVEELIIITDTKYKILSVNEAVERAIQKSDSELIGKPVFEMLFIKNPDGKLVNKETFFPENKTHPQNINTEFVFVNSRLAQRKIHIRVQTIKNAENNINQISFIISAITPKNQEQKALPVTLSKAKTKYDAISEKVKQELLNNSLTDIRLEIILLEKIENDMYMLQTLKEASKPNITRFDISQLSKQTVLREQDFASMYQVPIEFKILNFGIKDIAPLTVKNFPVQPDELTGPFFTISADIKRLAIIIKKLLDIGVLLASTEKNPFVSLTIQREKQDEILLKITASCTNLSEVELKDVTTAYYSKLYNKTNLHVASGLEGYLAQTLCNDSNIPLKIDYLNQQIIFSLTIKKAPTS